MFELINTIDFFETYNLTIVIVGLGILGIATLLHWFEDRPFSFPILALALGYVSCKLPLGLIPPDPEEHGFYIEHLTEIGVIISLMGVGLKIDRLPNWRTWSSTWRLLFICMPLTIAGFAILGWWLVGLTPAAAALLAAALAPTDPVLASDVQVGEPEAEVDEDDSSSETSDLPPEEKDDELRFTLTSEAGLNDSLAFPFVYFALFMLNEGAVTDWLSEWLAIDVLYRITVGVGLGVASGLVLSRILLRLPVETERERMTAGVGALAATLILYGITECLGGYGFLAVFIGGLTIKHRERPQQSHKSLHTFAEQSEQLLMTVLLISVGAAIAGGLFAALTWKGILLGILMIFIIRPLAGLISFIGTKRLTGLDRLIASFYGIRGIGCIYYLAYGLQKESFAEADQLWAICGFTVVLSICVHGITAAPVMNFRDQRLLDQSEE